MQLMWKIRGENPVDFPGSGAGKMHGHKSVAGLAG